MKIAKRGCCESNSLFLAIRKERKEYDYECKKSAK